MLMRLFAGVVKSCSITLRSRIGGTMPAVRERTLKELTNLLNQLDSGAYSVTNSPHETPFLTISFNSRQDLIFTVSLSESVVGGFITRESPGIYLVDGECYERPNFRMVIQSALSWAKRIKKDLQHQESHASEVRRNANITSSSDNTGEIILMKRTQKELENLLLAQNRKMKVLESALTRIENELDQDNKKESTGVRLTL